jgi:hypothetical protein
MIDLKTRNSALLALCVSYGTALFCVLCLISLKKLLIQSGLRNAPLPYLTRALLHNLVLLFLPSLLFSLVAGILMWIGKLRTLGLAILNTLIILFASLVGLTTTLACALPWIPRSP